MSSNDLIDLIRETVSTGPASAQPIPSGRPTDAAAISRTAAPPSFGSARVVSATWDVPLEPISLNQPDAYRDVGYLEVILQVKLHGPSGDTPPLQSNVIGVVNT